LGIRINKLVVHWFCVGYYSQTAISQGRMYLEEMFKKLGEDQQIKDDNWRRVVLVALMLSVLQHHPEAYLVSEH
jgi:hypothetical protein